MVCNLLHPHCSVSLHPDVVQGKQRRSEDLCLPPHESFHLLSDGRKKETLATARQAHSQLAFFGLDSFASVGEKLVAAFASCGGVEDAFRVLNQSPIQTPFSWAPLISGCVDCGYGRRALELYDSMQERGLRPSPPTVVSLLKACGDAQAMAKGVAIHAHAKEEGLEGNLFIVSALIMMYGKCGHVAEAEDVFVRLAQHDLVSWNAMLATYVDLGEAEKAIVLFEKIMETRMDPNERTMVSAIQAISLHTMEEENGLLQERQRKGNGLHSYVLMKGLDGNVYVHSALLGMYGKLGTIADVEHVFARVSCFHHEIVPWNVMLSAYVDRRYGEKALRLFRQMQQEGISPNETSYVTALQACCLMAEEEKDKSAVLEIGVALHSDACRNGFDHETSMCTMLVSMYARCERIREAEHLFEEALEHHDVVSWTSMLSMYVEMGEGEKALQLYVEMIDQGMDPNECTLVSAFQACVLVVEKEAALTKSLEIGRALLIEAFGKGFDQESLVIASAMMMFGKCGSVIEAESMFYARSSSHTDTVLSNALLFVYMENGQDRLALEMFTQVLDRVGGSVARTTKACINTATFFYVLRACTRVGSLELCYHIHFIIVSAGLDMDLLLTTMLVHAYGSFGSMENAGSAFDSLPGPDIASWNSLLSGHARRGDLGMTARVLEEIQMLSSIKPNEITLLLILSMCSHVGHVASSLELLDSIDLDDGACLTREHWASAEDLMGRAGNLPGILSVLSKIPAESCPIPWLCLLASCSRHGNLELGKVAFDQMISLNTMDTSGAYISMSNMYMNS